MVKENAKKILKFKTLYAEMKKRNNEDADVC